MSRWSRSRGCSWRGWAIAAANSLERRRGPGFGSEAGDHLLILRRPRSPAAASPRLAAWSRTRAAAARARPQAPIKTREARSFSEARLLEDPQPPRRHQVDQQAEIAELDHRHLARAACTRLICDRSAHPAAARSVFITFIPGASADSTRAPARALFESPRGDLDLWQLGHQQSLALSEHRRRGGVGARGAAALDLSEVHSTGSTGTPASEHQERKGSCRSSRRSNPSIARSPLARSRSAALSEEVRALAAERNARDPRPQLPAAGDPGRRRSLRRSASASRAWPPPPTPR